MELIKQVVPWFDKKEWETVYNLAYSMNPNLQRKAYQHISIWRARSSSLCMGVECTQAILHLYICESKSVNSDAPTFEDIDLQPIYCIAIMRFLNHLQGLCDHNKSLYQIATMYKIPDWIVNMRHETAHGNKLPPLFLLRDAANFIFGWLNKNYWQEEMFKMMDLTLAPSTLFDNNVEEAKIEDLLRLWKCINLYLLGGYENIDDIPNHELLRIALANLTAMCGEGELITHVSTRKTSKYILQNLLFMFERKNIHCGMAEILISKLLSDESFLPPDKSRKKNSYNKNVVEVLMNVWKDVLLQLEAQNLILKLMQALYAISCDTSDHRHHTASLWMQCLLSSLVNVYTDKCIQSKETFLAQVTEILSCPICPPEIIESIVESSLGSMTQMIPLKKLSYVERYAMQEFVKDVLFNPSENTSLFIFSLLELWEPPLSHSNKHKLSRLVKLYTKSSISSLDNEDDSQEIKTVEMLLQNFNCSHLLAETVEEISTNESVNDVEGNWSLHNGDENWSTCALGTVQPKNLNLINFVL